MVGYLLVHDLHPHQRFQRVLPWTMEYNRFPRCVHQHSDILPLVLWVQDLEAHEDLETTRHGLRYWYSYNGGDRSSGGAAYDFLGQGRCDHLLDAHLPCFSLDRPFCIVFSFLLTLLFAFVFVCGALV